MILVVSFLRICCLILRIQNGIYKSKFIRL